MGDTDRLGIRILLKEFFNLRRCEDTAPFNRDTYSIQPVCLADFASALAEFTAFDAYDFFAGIGDAG